MFEWSGCVRQSQREIADNNCTPDASDSSCRLAGKRATNGRGREFRSPLLASDAVAVAIELPTVAWLSLIDRCDPSCACFGAVGVVNTGWCWGRRSWHWLFNYGRGCGSLCRFFGWDVGEFGDACRGLLGCNTARGRAAVSGAGRRRACCGGYC